MDGCGMRGLRTVARVMLGALVVFMGSAGASVTATAQRIPDDLAQRLNERQLQSYRAYLTTRAAFDRKLDAYWSDVDERRAGRRHKRRSETSFTAADYVARTTAALRRPVDTVGRRAHHRVAAQTRARA